MNPKLPNLQTDQPLALTTEPTSKILCKNLGTLQKASESFIACENSKKNHRELSHNIQSSGEIKYIIGDNVL